MIQSLVLPISLPTPSYFLLLLQAKGFAESELGNISPKDLLPNVTWLSSPSGARQQQSACEKAGTTYRTTGMWAGLCSVKYWVASKVCFQRLLHSFWRKLISWFPLRCWLISNHSATSSSPILPTKHHPAPFASPCIVVCV